MLGTKRGMRSTLFASACNLGGKTSTNPGLDEEAKKWRLEFGRNEAEKIENRVWAAMPAMSI